MYLINVQLHVYLSSLYTVTLSFVTYTVGTSIVSDKLQLPLESLTVYLQETLGLREESGPLLIRMFQHGQSNPTYYLEYGGERMVLRKKPVSICVHM